MSLIVPKSNTSTPSTAYASKLKMSPIKGEMVFSCKTSEPWLMWLKEGVTIRL